MLLAFTDSKKKKRYSVFRRCLRIACAVFTCFNHEAGNGILVFANVLRTKNVPILECFVRQKGIVGAVHDFVQSYMHIYNHKYSLRKITSLDIFNVYVVHIEHLCVSPALYMTNAFICVGGKIFITLKYLLVDHSLERASRYLSRFIFLGSRSR